MNREELKEVFGEKKLKQIIEFWYINEKLSTVDMEIRFKEKYDINVSRNVTYGLLKDFSIPIRDISESVSMSMRTLDYSIDFLKKYPRIREAIDGLLISDGSICNNKQKYHRFSISSSQEEFINYCRGFLEKLNPSEIHARKALGYARNKGYEKNRYSIDTAYHPSITKQRIRWYDGLKKIIPKDIKITSLMLKMWYYGDGSIVTNRDSNTCTVRLSTDGFASQDVDFLVGQLYEQVGIQAKNSDNRIKIKSNSISTFFNFIGKKSDIDCYSYKFDVDEWRFWKGMKAVAKEIAIPYDRLNHLVGTKSIEFNRSPGGKKVLFTESQILKLKTLHTSGLLMADPRKNSAAVTKGMFKREPNAEKMYKSIFSKGFPVVSMSEAERVIMFNRLNNIPTITIDDNEIKASYRDNDLAINYHPHLFGVNCKGYKSPLDAFNERKTLMFTVDRFLSKNIEASDSNVRNSICSSKGTKRTSVFPVRVAKTLYTLYGKDNMKVLDPCAGYSSRLMGFYASARGGNYVGIDPCVKTYNGLIKTKQEIQHMTKGHHAEFYNGCLEDVMPNMNDSYDMIFTSPPYFDLERYSSEETQSHNKYPKYEDWLDNFLFTLIKESHRLLKDDGAFLLNIYDCQQRKIIEHMEAFAKSMFRVETVLLMTSPSRYSEEFSEPIFVFRK